MVCVTFITIHQIVLMEYARAIYLGGKVIYANDKRLNDKSYIEWGLYCPECGEEVHLRHGSIREPYFAHFKQITDTECSLRVSIEGNNEGRWTELEIGRGQRRELFQQHFLALVATNDCDFYMKIAKVKDTINSDILVSLRKKVINYLVKNAIEIIETSVQLYRNNSNESKFKALNERIINEAIEYLCVESSLNVLQQLIYYCISFSEQLIKNNAGNVENTNIVIVLINKVAVIIANTDWTKEIFTLRSSNLLQPNILSPVEQTHDNLADYSQDRKLNGELRDTKTPNGYVGSSKKTKSTIKAGGKTPDSFNRSIAFYLEGFKDKVQLYIDLNNLEIYLLNYSSLEKILKLGKINLLDGEIYQWSFYEQIDQRLKYLLRAKINELIQPNNSDKLIQPNNSDNRSLNKRRQWLNKRIQLLKKEEPQNKLELAKSPYAEFNITSPNIGDVIAVNSRNQFNRLFNQLQKDGFIVKFGDDKRSIEIVGIRLIIKATHDLTNL